MSIKKFVIGFIIGFLLCSGVSYAYRFEKPQKLTAFDDASLKILNDVLEKMWNVINGRYNVDVVTTVPTTSATEGDVKAYYSGSTRRLYIYINSAWRYISFDG